MRFSVVRTSLVAAGLLAAATEISHRWASSSGLPRRRRDASTEAIIVLGYRSGRYGQLHPVQRWRSQIAVRSMDPRRSSTLIMTGWAAGGDRSEAEMMATYTRDVLGVPADRIVLEEQARSTWENIGFSLPVAERSDVIKIASDPLHAWRARQYIARTRPDLVDRLEPAADYRLGEHWLLKATALAYEAIRPLARLTMTRRTAP